jgi:hypothetical protein
VEVRIAMRPKLDLALIIAFVIGVPINPVAPIIKMLRAIFRCKSATDGSCQSTRGQLTLEYKKSPSDTKSSPRIDL